MTPDWLASWPLNVATLDGREVTVMVGVVRTDEGPRVAFQIDKETTLVLQFPTGPLLQLPTGPLLMANLRQAINERLRMHNRGEG